MFFLDKSKRELINAVQIRIARPTDKIKEIERFYCEGLGLKKIGSFEKHNGYSGIMIGLPRYNYHLEFTEHEKGSPCPAPTKDNLLIFYLPNKNDIGAIKQNLTNLGYKTVPAENPYWAKDGITFEDPDGWRIVLMNTSGI